MKVSTWLIVLASSSVILALGAIYVMFVRPVWLAEAQIDAWEEIKYQAAFPTAELPIEIVGKKYEWDIRYPSSRRLEGDVKLVENFAKESSAGQEQADDVHVMNELHVWKGCPVQIHLKSADVLHSFFLPRQRLKQDAVPGQVTDVRLEETQSNITWDSETAEWKHGDKWEFACAEHSGQGPTKMRGQLFVHETKADFLKWLKQAEEVSLKPLRRQ